MIKGWSCHKCTYQHRYPAQHCKMCNALRVLRQEMQDFFAGRPPPPPPMSLSAGAAANDGGCDDDVCNNNPSSAVAPVHHRRLGGSPGGGNPGPADDGRSSSPSFPTRSLPSAAAAPQPRQHPLPSVAYPPPPLFQIPMSGGRPGPQQ